MDDIVWWDRIVVEGISFPDGEMSVEDIPEDAWAAHVAKHNDSKDRYGLRDDPSEIVAIAGDIMVGYAARPDSAVMS